MTAANLHGLVAHAGANDALYEDPFLAGRPLLLRSARPRAYSPRTPVLLVHHGDLRNGADFRDFWLPRALSGYRWGVKRKRILLERESATR